MSAPRRTIWTSFGSFPRFALAGLATAAVYFGLFGILEALLAWDYRLAVSLAYAAAIVFHFLVNRNVTFDGRHGRIGWQLIRYATVVALNYAVTILITTAFVEILQLSSYFGVIVAAATTTISGYILFRDWVFRSRAATRSY
jgi:putative flippase GtrA